MVSSFCEQLGKRDGVVACASRFARRLAPPRLDAAAEPALPGESSAQRARWLRVWAKVDLSGVHGFLWDGAAREVLRQHHSQLAVSLAYADAAAAASSRTIVGALAPARPSPRPRDEGAG